jgi:3-oxoacyl-[acyl-carrier protein] reductase
MAEISPSEPSFDLAGRTIIVTGGGKGIGKVYCRHLAAAGARLIVADIDGEASVEVAKEIVSKGGVAVAEPTDVSDEKAVGRMAEAAIEAFGRIDGLINNAALMSDLPRQPWHQLEAEEWDRVMAVNLRGMFLCCRAVYPQMKKQGKGKIVNISSSRVWAGAPDRLHYTTSKMGVVGLTRALAREVGDDNIVVNAVAPGFTLSETQVATSSNEYLASKRNDRRALKRAQVPEDLVGVVMFLLSDASNFMTGQTITVDGGHMMH